MSFVCLVYHRIAADSAARADPYTVTAAQFEGQMAWLKERNYAVLSLGQALTGLGDRSRAQGRMVALSFDDGYVDFRRRAWPVLRALGFGATLFVVAGKAGGRADWPGGGLAPLLGWDELQDLAKEGVEIGAHGLDHRPLDKLPPDELEGHLIQMRDRFDHHLGLRPQGLAYPYGRRPRAAAGAISRAGFDYGATARGGFNRQRTPPTRLRRTLVTGRDWGPRGRLRFAIKVRTGYAHFADWRMDLRRVP